ncbi:hypothetical protein EU538_01575 [Candidatus Thorarchaeota archaeon]|nr:MAG: hypothetical protein EU538_01575 [Candidatus Thorarchaeota archaeon]
MLDLEQRIEELRAKILQVESINHRLKALENRIEDFGNVREGTAGENMQESTIWQSLEELRGFAERLALAVTQLESEIETIRMATRHLEDD